MSKTPLSDEALAQLFTEARTYNAWLPTAVSDETLTRLADLMKLGPTAANSCPARLVFLKSEAAKQRLAPHLSEANRAKTMQGFDGNIGKYVSLAYLEAEKEAF